MHCRLSEDGVIRAIKANFSERECHVDLDRRQGTGRVRLVAPNGGGRTFVGALVHFRDATLLGLRMRYWRALLKRWS